MYYAVHARALTSQDEKEEEVREFQVLFLYLRQAQPRAKLGTPCTLAAVALVPTANHSITLQSSQRTSHRCLADATLEQMRMTRAWCKDSIQRNAQRARG